MNDMTIGGFDRSDQTQTMSSREIGKLVEVRHDNVKRTMERLAEKGLISFTPSEETSHSGAGARPVEVYLVGKRDSYVVVAQLCPEFTARLVDRWAELEQMVRAEMIALPHDYPSALRALAERAESEQRLLAKVEEDAPKVAFAEQVEVAADAISMGEAAKIAGTGRTRLSTLLKHKGWLTRYGEPYQAKIDAGYLDVKISSWDHPKEGLKSRVTPLVTGKGLSRIVKMVRDEGLAT